MNIFYENLAKRQEQIDKYKQKEGIKVTMEIDPAVTVITFKNLHQYYKVKSLIPTAPTVTMAPEPTQVIPVTTAAAAAGSSSAPGSRLDSRRNTSNTLANEASLSSDDDDDGDDDGDYEHSVGGRYDSTKSEASQQLYLSSCSNSAKDPAATAPKTASVGEAVRILESWDEVEALVGKKGPGAFYCFYLYLFQVCSLFSMCSHLFSI